MSSDRRQGPESERAIRLTGFRPDVEGLRAVAIGAVLLDHAGVPFLSGGYVGVDVFFVISGFLITRLLLAEIDRTGTISLLRFYARRARRLLPLAMLVLALIALLSAVLFSASRNALVSGDIVTAGVYVVNWHLAAQAVDYFGATAAASPVQHFWSLAVEEQFYIVWPALLLAIVWWRGRRGRAVRPAVALVLAAVGIVSFVHGVDLVHADAGAAYFSTTGRAWELALGGLLALALSAPRRGPAAARHLTAALAWAGLATILAAAVGYGDLTPFPGAAGLAPTLGAGALIAAGAMHVDVLPLRLLSGRAMRHVGRVSYSWYLWHWPLLVFAGALWGHLSAWAGLAVVLVSWLPAYASHRLVENPIRRAGALVAVPRRGLTMGTACAGVAVIVGLLLQMAGPTVQTAPAREVHGAEASARTAGAGSGSDPGSASDPGSGSTSPAALQQSARAVRPNPREATKDRGVLFSYGCLVRFSHTESGPCTLGDLSSHTTVVLFGDSHALQYAPPLVELADRHHWRLVDLTKAGCTPAQVREYYTPLKREFSECDTWRTGSLQRMAEQAHPRLVVVSTSTLYQVAGSDGPLSYEASVPALRKGLVATLRQLREIAPRVALIADIPHAPDDIADCVASSLDDLPHCAFDASSTANADAFDVPAARSVPGVTVLDPQPLLCPGGRCAAVIGNALVYRETGHLTATFARTLAPWLAQQLPDPGGHGTVADADTRKTPTAHAAGATTTSTGSSASTGH